jgi:hypothetical protein
MNSGNFAKGVGIGLVVGSAIGMAVSMPQQKASAKKTVVGRALRTVGDIVESIGDTIGI